MPKSVPRRYEVGHELSCDDSLAATSASISPMRVRGAAQRGQQPQRLVGRQPHDRRLNGDAQVGDSRRRRDQNRGADEAGQELLGVDRVAVAANLLELLLDLVDVGDRVGRVLLQRRGLQQSAPLSGGQLRHDDLSARRTMRGHARARLQRKAQRLGRFHAVEIDDLVARQRGQVAALAEFVHQVTQHGVARAVVGVVEQQAFGHPAQPGADPVVAAVVLPDQQSGAFELLQHAMQRRLGHPGRLDQPLQREQLVLRCDQFEQREQPQRGSLAGQFRSGDRSRLVDPADLTHGPSFTSSATIKPRNCSEKQDMAYRI